MKHGTSSPSPQPSPAQGSALPAWVSEELARRAILANTPHPAPTEPWPDGVIARYLTVGGATVDLRTHTFRTHYTGQGRPYVGDEAHEVDGFNWACLGCDATSATDGRNYICFDYGRYLPTERSEARQDAQAHAEKCRALPRPAVTS